MEFNPFDYRPFLVRERVAVEEFTQESPLWERAWEMYCKLSNRPEEEEEERKKVYELLFLNDLRYLFVWVNLKGVFDEEDYKKAFLQCTWMTPEEDSEKVKQFVKNIVNPKCVERYSLDLQPLGEKPDRIERMLNRLDIDISLNDWWTRFIIFFYTDDGINTMLRIYKCNVGDMFELEEIISAKSKYIDFNVSFAETQPGASTNSLLSSWRSKARKLFEIISAKSKYIDFNVSFAETQPGTGVVGTSTNSHLSSCRSKAQELWDNYTICREARVEFNDLPRFFDFLDKEIKLDEEKDFKANFFVLRAATELEYFDSLPNSHCVVEKYPDYTPYLQSPSGKSSPLDKALSGLRTGETISAKNRNKIDALKESLKRLDIKKRQQS